MDLPKGCPYTIVSGAKDGIGIIIGIFPYVLAIFIAVKTFEASGAFDFIRKIFAFVASPFNLPPEVFSVAYGKTLFQRRVPGLFHRDS